MVRKKKKTLQIEKIQMGKRAGRGSHGSLTKAGKVRAITPKIPKTSRRKRKGPLKTNRTKAKRLNKKKYR